MNDLVEFLTARLNDAEQRERRKHRIADDVACPKCNWIRAYTMPLDSDADVVFDCGHQISGARFSELFCTPCPDEFVLADIAAKRRIIFLAQQLPKLTAAYDRFDNNRDAWAEVLKQLATPYASHPEYRSEWVP